MILFFTFSYHTYENHQIQKQWYARNYLYSLIQNKKIKINRNLCKKKKKLKWNKNKKNKQWNKIQAGLIRRGTDSQLWGRDEL